MPKGRGFCARSGKSLETLIWDTVCNDRALASAAPMPLGFQANSRAFRKLQTHQNGMRTGGLEPDLFPTATMNASSDQPPETRKGVSKGYARPGAKSLFWNILARRSPSPDGVESKAHRLTVRRC